MARTPFGESKVWTEEEIVEYYGKHYAQQPGVIRAANGAIEVQTQAYTKMRLLMGQIIIVMAGWQQTGDVKLLEAAEEAREQAEQHFAAVEREARRYERVTGAPMEKVAEIRANVAKARELLIQIDALLPRP